MPAYTPRTDNLIHEARGVPCPAEELTLRQYIDHLRVVGRGLTDETTRNLEDDRTLFWLWVWWSLRRHAEFGWQMPKRVRDNTAVAAL